MITPDWAKSSYSQGGATNCVEARSSADVSAVDMRDTQNRYLGHLAFDRSEWTALVSLASRDRV